MTFTPTKFATHCGQLTTGIDPLLNVFLRLHVASDFVSESSFKTAALLRLRETNVYKRFKLPQEAVEQGLMMRALTPLAMYALALLYNVEVNIRVDQCYFRCGTAPHYWVDAKSGKLTKMEGTDSLLEVNPCKPLYALSHYTAAALLSMCSKLNLSTTGTKPELYASLMAVVSTVCV